MDSAKSDVPKEESCSDTISPICFFYFSYPFAIGSPKPLHKNHNTLYRTMSNSRIKSCHQHGWKRKRKCAKKCNKWTLVKYLTESVRINPERLPSLEDVVDTLQAAWLPPDNFNKCFSEERNQNLNTISMASNNNNNANQQEKNSSSVPSPVMLRRRLSAPETIMRKHALNQLRSNSTETDTTQISSSVSSLRYNNTSSFWNRGSTTGSDSNLASRKPYKRDPDLMRKSTLLRRMWSREFTGSVSRLYNDEIFAKKLSIKSRSPVRSTTSSLEQINKMQTEFNSKQTKTNTNSYNSSFTSDIMSTGSSTSESNKSILDTSSTDIKVSSVTTTTTTEREIYTTTQNTTANSDSAYTNTQTYISSIKSETENSNNNSINNNNNNNNTNNNNNNNNNNNVLDMNENVQEQNTNGIQILPDLNSNDVSKTNLIDKEIQEHNQPASFYLKRKDDVIISADHSRIMKYMISNVGTGSPYSKPTEVPQIIVPRFSALPRSESMEVNTSSAESTDKESDTMSLVDSLDDPNSPRQLKSTPRLRHDDKPVRGDLSMLLPDNSSGCIETPRTRKGSAFYVPIEGDSLKTDKTVAERLPEKVRCKLSKRQQEIEQKKCSVKNKIDHCFDMIENQSYNIISSPVVQNSKTESEIISESGTSWANNGVVKKVRKDKNAKQLLRSLPSYKINARGELVFNPNAVTNFKKNLNHKKKKCSKYSDSSESSSNTITLLPPPPPLWSNQSSPRSLSLHVSKEEYVPEMNVSDKTQDKINCNNTIEILEIVECVEQPAEKTPKNLIRSKIPILVQTHITQVPHKQVQMQTVYHAYDLSQTPQYSPKTDQLIANILIDALNKTDTTHHSENSKITVTHSNEKLPAPLSPGKQILSRYQQKFDIIPEEKLSSFSSSTEDSSIVIKTDEKIKSIEVETQVETFEFSTSIQLQTEKKYLMDASSQTETVDEFPHFPKDRAALAMMKDEDFANIPKGWITFYMLRKNPESPNSSTDEGTTAEDKTNRSNKIDGLELRPVLVKRRLQDTDEKYNNSLTTQQCINNNMTSKEDKGKDSTSFNTIVSKSFSSSSESSKIQSFNDEQDITEQKSMCPTLPVPLPLRQGRRQSHRRGRYKTTYQNTETNSSQTPGGWSVTVSGTSASGQPAPDFEMRLKFPCAQTNNQSDSGLGDEHPKSSKSNFQQQSNCNKFHLPPPKSIQTEKYTVITKNNTEDVVDNNKNFRYLPDLIKNKNQKQIKPRDSSVPVTRQRHSFSTMTSMPQLRIQQRQEQIHSSMVGMRPKQTITSYRRFSLNHSSHLGSHFRISDDIHTDNEELIQLPECLPAILAVTGSAISPENKPKVPTMSERDLTRNQFNFGQHHA